MKKIVIFDSTLRDGAQAPGISFSVGDKIKIAEALDRLGVDYIEAGNPGSNPKDLEFFEYFKGKSLQHAKLIAFGSTRRKGILPEEDNNLKALLSAGTDSVCIFGKSWDFHVTNILNATLEENLAMITDTIRFLRDNGKEVIFDAEHFFDGYKNNASYAMAALDAAVAGGASCLVLCDTNGGCFPSEIEAIVKTVAAKHPSVGIHTHNDGEMAVANSIVAVEAGANHVQGTFTGFGERCGNANLSAIIPSLQIKAGYACIPAENMPLLTETARYISETANLSLSSRAAFVGRNAFAHKAGMHIDGVTKASTSFEHVDPEAVGNQRQYLISEVAGGSAFLAKMQKIDPAIAKGSPEMAAIIQGIKEREHMGYQYEGAEASLSLFIRKKLGKFKPSFKLVNFRVIGERPYDAGRSASARICIEVNGQRVFAYDEGIGPVGALDKALRKALYEFFPVLKDVYLTDYKVRVLDNKHATESMIRVLLESTDGKDTWTTVGASGDILDASYQALVDSIEYKLKMS